MFALVVSILLATSASSQPAAQRIDLANFSFSPRPIQLAAGRPVTLTFVNRSNGGHDFTAKAFFARSRILAGSAPGGEIELRAGQTKHVTLVPSAGTYKVHCGHFLHAQMGMTDRIVVR